MGDRARCDVMLMCNNSVAIVVVILIASVVGTLAVPCWFAWLCSNCWKEKKCGKQEN